MLIYVREAEREAIMSDNLTLAQQIPQELREYFRIEELYFQQIQDDNNKTDMNKRVYLITDETLKSAGYIGPLFADRSLDHADPNGSDSESNLRYHMLLYVSYWVSINDFITMIKRRFFADDPNVELEDIWLYRSQQKRVSTTLKHHYEVMNKYCYGTHLYDYPLFTKKHYKQSHNWQKDPDKWKEKIMHS